MDFQEKARLEHEEGLRLEALKAQRARDAAKENLQALEAQKQVKKDRQNDQRNQWLAEGADLAAAAEEFEKSKIEQKNLAKQARLEYISQIDAQKQMIADIARLDAENEALDDQKREKFLSAKAKMTKMQKAKMKSIFDEKQAQRGKMAEKLAKEYREQEDNSEYLLKKAQEEKDFEQRMREKAKQEKLLKDQKDIAEHRAGQLKVKGIFLLIHHSSSFQNWLMKNVAKWPWKSSRWCEWPMKSSNKLKLRSNRSVGLIWRLWPGSIWKW